MHLQVKEMKVVSSKNFLTKLYHHPPDIGKLLIFPKDGGVDYENQFWSSIAQCQLLKHLTEERTFSWEVLLVLWASIYLLATIIVIYLCIHEKWCA